jgi:hypothetical protein
MLKKSLAVVLLVACFAGTAAADIVCPDSSYCTIAFGTTRDRLTIIPDGSGDTFTGLQITLRVFLKDCNGAALVGVPREEVVIYNAGLCICPGGTVADAATDVNGMAAFTGTIRGGGCVESLTIFAEGAAICTVAVKTNSPDGIPEVGGQPCAVDASDLGNFASALGQPANYSICEDYIEDGVIDSSDLGLFAQALQDRCV